MAQLTVTVSARDVEVLSIKRNMLAETQQEKLMMTRLFPKNILNVLLCA